MFIGFPAYTAQPELDCNVELANSNLTLLPMALLRSRL